MATVTIVLDNTDLEKIKESFNNSSPKEIIELLIASLEEGEEA